MDSYDQLEKRKFGIGFAFIMILTYVFAWIIFFIPDRWWKILDDNRTDREWEADQW